MQDSGTACYIISRDWLDSYKKYCFYSDLKHGQQASPNQNHLEKYNPGKILNEELIHTEDKYLKGTGNLKGFEKSVYDTYLHKDKRERLHFEIISEELWKFLKEKYDCDHEIKRYYVKGSGYYSMCQAETRFK